jgi:hypothetical protein
LISVLPVASLAGLGLLIAAFAAMLVRRKPVALVLLAMLVAIIFCLDGVTSIVEPLPRFATTYQLYGFVNYVRHTGAVAPGVAAYFSWPGFFALIGFAAKAAGAHSLLPLLKWWPVIIDTLIVVPFMLLTRALKITWRARWLAALLLCVGNWVGQDYFSPQSLNFLLYLAFIAILLTWFTGQVTSKPGSRRALRAGRRPRVPGERSASQVSATQRALLVVLVIGIFTASVISHQLTPFLMIASCAGLVIVGRCAPRGLPVLLAVIAIGWISFATVGYWSGHLSTIFGQIGRLSGTINASVGARLIGTPMHEFPVYGRLVLAGLIVGMALLGLLRRWHRGVTDRALLILLLAPLSIAALQNYGGEIALRIYLFALPAAAVLAACLFFPQADTKPDTGTATAPDAGTATAPDSGTATAPEPADRRTRPAKRRTWPATRLVPAVASGLVAVTLAGLFMLTRYGNEAYEQIPRGEKAAMDYIYARAGGGTSVLWLSRPAGINATPQMPWQYRDIAEVQFVSRDSPRNPADVAGVIADLKHLGRGAFLIVTTTEATFIRQTASFAPHWVRSFRAAMSGAPGVRVVLNNRDAAVYQARLPASAPRARSNLHAARSVSGSTIWTPVGLAALALAVLLLAARELIRAALPGRRALMRPLALAACPAVLLLLIAVIERFKVIS